MRVRRCLQVLRISSITKPEFAKKTAQFCAETPNGLRYLRWGGDGEAVQPEK